MPSATCRQNRSSCAGRDGGMGRRELGEGGGEWLELNRRDDLQRTCIAVTSLLGTTSMLCNV